ncbi:hypothetical protein DKX38_016948 [Salix brachista]|uniref:Uncharacterized protein n=1 Tax=Salix brachista TaxID=2182728 RepID=A0A5N5KU36_9ROSI|nr:hypothetical protein DKX38_016948 [Salix brachista]
MEGRRQPMQINVRMPADGERGKEKMEGYGVRKNNCQNMAVKPCNVTRPDELHGNMAVKPCNATQPDEMQEIETEIIEHKEDTAMTHSMEERSLEPDPPDSTF